MEHVLFSGVFDRRKVEAIAPLLPACYRAMEALAGRPLRLPRLIEAMTAAEVREGRALGKGHGLYYPAERRIKVDAAMSPRDILLNVVHENLHCAFPRATDEEINFRLLPAVWKMAAGRGIPRKWATGTPVRRNPVRRWRLLDLRASPLREKKLVAVFLDEFTGRRKTVHFGARGYEDFTQHRDRERQRRYLERHGRGREDWEDPTTPGALSRWVLWNKTTLKASVADFRRRFGL